MRTLTFSTIATRRMLGAPFGSSATIVTRSNGTNPGMFLDDAVNISISGRFIWCGAASLLDAL